MLDVALSILALIAGGVTIELFGAAKAPADQAEDRGLQFELKVPRGAEEFQNGNAS